MPRSTQYRLLTLSIAVLLCAAACTPASPEEQVATARGQYSVELVSWRLEQIPQATEETTADESTVAEEGADEVVADAAAEEAPGAEGEMSVEVPDHLATNLVNNLYFDILVSTTADEPLSTLTIDLTHAAATQEEKNVYRIPLDVTGVIKGSGEQITATLENVEDVEENDLFSVEVRSSVGEAERSEYPEFSG